MVLLSFVTAHIVGEGPTITIPDFNLLFCLPAAPKTAEWLRSSRSPSSAALEGNWLAG
jgi:hypothetical protein